jgi:hypothetical protein
MLTHIDLLCIAPAFMYVGYQLNDLVRRSDIGVFFPTMKFLAGIAIISLFFGVTSV